MKRATKCAKRTREDHTSEAASVLLVSYVPPSTRTIAYKIRLVKQIPERRNAKPASQTPAWSANESL